MDIHEWRTWYNFEGMFPKLFLRYWPVSWKYGQKTTKCINFTFFGVKNVFFKGQHFKKKLGNIPSKFYHDLYTLKIIQKWVYFPWRSFLPWDRFCLNLLSKVCLWTMYNLLIICWLGQSGWLILNFTIGSK